MLRITLHRHEDKRVRSGHPWIFSNEIKEISGDRTAGAAAEIFDSGGKYIGTGYYNPNSLIAARILSTSRENIDSGDFYLQRLRQALELRRSLYPEETTFRLVFGESDFLPGLVVDKYGDYLSLQFLTAGIDCRRELIIEALTELFEPAGIIARNDVGIRSLEGLDQKVEILRGQIPAEIVVAEHGLQLTVDLLHGQKTGHFLDQKENHLLLEKLAGGKKVLDCFCYSGSWGVHAGRFGATKVTCVDISERALGLARGNAEANGFGNITECVEADVFEFLRSLKGREDRYDVIVLDPPAFVKSKKMLKEAVKGYLTINRRAMEILPPGGYLVTCSCSHHMDRELFRQTLTQAAQQAGRQMRLVETRGQSPDHPVLLAVPETEYLKCVVLQAV